jgi:hypothetical protein
MPESPDEIAKRIMRENRQLAKKRGKIGHLLKRGNSSSEERDPQLKEISPDIPYQKTPQPRMKVIKQNLTVYSNRDTSKEKTDLSLKVVPE